MSPPPFRKFTFLAFSLATLWTLGAMTSAHAACDAPFCSLNTDWGAEAAAHLGRYGLGVRFGYARQDQLRHGIHATDDGSVRELYTINRRWTGSFDYDFGAQWGLSLDVPLLVDDHAHIDAANAAQQDAWHFTGAGDAQVLFRRRLRGTEHSGHGIEFGLKLPTGHYTDTNAAGQMAERFVQPGTGTTDLVLGSYYTLNNPDLNVTTFVHAQWQRALAPRADYQPGSILTLDAGIQRQTTERMDSLVQFHAVVEGRDTGAAADNANSGYEALYLSPGLAYHPNKRYGLFGFFNQPVYRRYNGAQLTADWSVLVGASYAFGGPPSHPDETRSQ